ncbi:MAG: hypothetical protein AAGD13_07850 [Pseudomonadota bacterium]
MSFIRPEAARFLRIWAEPALYVAGALLCGVKGIGLLANGAWVGGILTAIGLFCIFAFYGAVTRAAYATRTQTRGPGVVSVVEGRITFMGPLGGAVIARDALLSVDIVSGEPGPDGNDLHWVLTDESYQRAAIPASATDADKLLDVLGVLPGFDHEAMVEAMKADHPGRFPVWQRYRR